MPGTLMQHNIIVQVVNINKPCFFHLYVFSYYQSNTLSQKSFTPDKKERKTFVFSLEKTSVRETIAKINHCFFKNKKNMYKNVDDF